MPFLTELTDMTIRPAGGRSWRLTEDLIYQGERETFTIPAGYRTDFASIPSALRSPTGLDPYDESYVRAAIVHDWLITDAIPARLVTSRDTDGIFRRIMREEGVDLWTRWTMWAAVRAGAAFNSRRAWGRQLGRDLPIMLLVAIPALPIGVAAVINLVTRAYLWPMKRVTGKGSR